MSVSIPAIRRAGLLPAILCGLLLGVACGGEDAAHGQSEGEGETGPAVAGEGASVDSGAGRAPGFELPDLKGSTVSLASLRGKTVVIDFWATWCPPCIFQIPILNAIHERYGAAGVEVLGVAVDVEGESVVAPYASENGIEYPVLLGDESLARKFGAPGFPALVVVSPDGRIHSRHVGLIEEAEIEAAIADIRGDASPAPGEPAKEGSAS